MTVIPFPAIPFLLAGVFLLSAWSAVAGMSAVAHVDASRLPPLIRRMARDDKDGPPASGMVGVANDAFIALGAAGICAFLQVGSFRMFTDSEVAGTYGLPVQALVAMELVLFVAWIPVVAFSFLRAKRC